jgi:hypothetical protein
MGTQAILQWVGSCRQQLLHAGATVQHTYVQCFRTAPLGDESRPWGRAWQETANDWVFVCLQAICSLGLYDLPVDDEAHLLFRDQLTLGESVDFYSYHPRRCRISCAVVMFTG